MSSGFISETEIEERKKVRQQEWEKVRKPDQPLEAPEEDYDHRSLFERLQEQKQKREVEFEESHQLKHMVKGLDDDEVEFLNLVDQSKIEEERKKYAEEAREMADFRNRVATLQEQSLENRIQHEIKNPLQPVVKNTNKTSQTKLLAGAVVKKRSLESQNVDPKRPKIESTNGDDKQEYCVPVNAESVPVPESDNPLRCIGILPGLISYDESSDSASSDFDTDSDDSPRVDLLGRKIPKTKDIEKPQ